MTMHARLMTRQRNTENYQMLYEKLSTEIKLSIAFLLLFIIDLKIIDGLNTFVKIKVHAEIWNESFPILFFWPNFIKMLIKFSPKMANESLTFGIYFNCRKKKLTLSYSTLILNIFWIQSFYKLFSSITKPVNIVFLITFFPSHILWNIHHTPLKNVNY